MTGRIKAKDAQSLHFLPDCFSFLIPKKNALNVKKHTVLFSFSHGNSSLNRGKEKSTIKY